ncbi:MAG: DEAD/DEAH box helicase [Magnetococcales bacterium]|nr:DEAD/DEAH box helicase [Magnetococcales bacterium]
MNPSTRTIDPLPLLNHLLRRYRDRIVGHLKIPNRPGEYAPFPPDLDPRILQALQGRGLNQLYRHQALAWQNIRAGQHTVIVTPTASGKTLCYNLPVLQAALTEQKKALYLFPTKALSQDQVAELLALNQSGTLGIKTHTFDGDTPSDQRKAIRLKGDIIVTNPDMLHQGILPHHTKWAQFFENLHFIVIDELHTYRGVFGAHMANLLRRLKRITTFYGSKPVFILCSATIANPGDLATRLVGEPVITIDQNGAPAGEKHLLVFNPPVINPDLGLRASARSQTTRIARIAIRAGLKCIVFAHSRLMVEVITRYLKDTFDHDPRNPPRIAGYRGGYLPTERRNVEKSLRSGTLDAVVTTSALELGVDIGALDVCILNGYPGTIAATWQRLGRAGRRNRPTLGVLVASSAPLDQFIATNPDFFFGASPEHARVHPDQLLILMDHVRCAAFELPFHASEQFGPENLTEMLEILAEEKVIHREGQRWFWMADSYPAASVSLRSVADGNFVVIDRTHGHAEVIAEVDFSAVPMTLHEEAIYMVQARSYQVEQLDWKGRKAFVRKTDADYYTDAIDYSRLKILADFERRQIPGASTAHGEVHLTRRVAGYKKIRYHTHENVGYGKINLPDQEMHTTATWWEADPAILEQTFDHPDHIINGFLGAAYTLHTVAAVLSMSDHHDLGRAVGDGNAQWFATVENHGRGTLRDANGHPIHSLANHPGITLAQFKPAVFLYDNYPGGIGLSQPLYEQQDVLTVQAIHLIKNCRCTRGCPACVGPVPEENRPHELSPKEAALKVLDLFNPKTASVP